MSEADFYDVLRKRAIKVISDAAGDLALHPKNSFGHMAPHVAKEKVAKLRNVARELEALANVADPR